MEHNHYLKYGGVDSWRDRLDQSPLDGHADRDTWQAFEVYGSLPSPPCVKVATYLRWKRLPFVWRSSIDEDLNMMFGEPRFAHIEESIMPYAVFPDGRSMNDSTFILRATEDRYPERPVMPSCDEDPSLWFACQLLEDFADEWIVRCVYGFRWNRPEVRDFSGRFVAHSFVGGGDRADAVAQFVVDKQLSTNNRSDAFVEGAYTDDIIYPTFEKVVEALERHFSAGIVAPKFMCGDSPSNVDFAFYGMFYQFIQDKIPSALMTNYQATTAWIHRMHDTSGFEGRPLRFTELLMELMKIASDSYLPFLQTNALRLSEDPGNVEMITTEIFARDQHQSVTHTQRPYPYQAKCFQWLREDLAKAMNIGSPLEAQNLEAVLNKTGCWSFLNPNS